MDNYFKYRERIGLGQIANQALPPAPIANPFAVGRAWNLTAQFELQRRDPALASRLRALAEGGR